MSPSSIVYDNDIINCWKLYNCGETSLLLKLLVNKSCLDFNNLYIYMEIISINLNTNY